MSDPSVEDAIKQIVLANEDGEIKSIAVVMINMHGEPEMQIGMSMNTAYALIASLEILKLKLIEKLVTDGGLKPRERD